MPNPTFVVAVCLSLFADETSSNPSAQPPSTPPAIFSPQTSGGSFSPSAPSAAPPATLQTRPPSIQETPAVSPANGLAQQPPSNLGGGNFSLPPTSPAAPVKPAETSLGGFRPPTTQEGLPSGPVPSLPPEEVPVLGEPAVPSQLQNEAALPTTTEPIAELKTFDEGSLSVNPPTPSSPLNSSTANQNATLAAPLNLGTASASGAARPSDRGLLTNPRVQQTDELQPSSASDLTFPGGQPNPADKFNATDSNRGTSSAPQSFNREHQPLSGSPTVAPRMNQATAPENVSLKLARSVLEMAEQRTALRQRNESSLSLLEALTVTQDANQRKLIIQQYWRVAITNLNLTHALEEKEIIRAVAATTPEDQTTLNAAIRIAETRVVGLQLQLQNDQFDLIDIMGSGNIEQAPWPSDSPYVGRYRTNFERYTEFRTMPSEIARIHHSLPLMLELIESRAEAISAIDRQVLSTAEAYQFGQGSLSKVLESLNTLSQQRAALLTSIEEYNQMISNYALTVAPQGLAPESVVPMLIKTTAPSLARDASSIRRTNFQAPENTIRSSQGAGSNWRSLTPR